MWKASNFPIKKSVRCDCELPPYYPSMFTKGISTYLTLPVLNDAVLATIQEFIEIGGETRHVDFLRSFSGWTIDKKEDGLLITPFPTSAGQLVVQSRQMSPFGDDHYVQIDDEKSWGLVIIAGDISEEIMALYELKRESFLPNKKSMCYCPNRWKYHNVCPTDRVLYKNLIIALDNEAVRREYEEK